MDSKLIKEQEIKKSINNAFRSAEVTVAHQGRINVRFRAGILPAFASYLKNYLNFVHLVMISCVDWLEDNQFELVYHLWSYEEKIHTMIKVRLDRDNPRIKSLSPLWAHAETYEREIHEMFGVDFEGHPGLTDLILEDWADMPPMRRDFNTRAFVQETFEWRKGREDAQDVRQIISERYGEKIPEFKKDK